MLARILLGVTAALMLAAWGIVANAGDEHAARTYMIDWPKHGIRATFQYGTQPMSPGRTVCAGKVGIENYGNKSYAVLFFNVVFYSESRERIATDRFSLSSNLKPGAQAEIPYDPRNPLNPINLTESYSECPKGMRWARVVLDAF